MKYTLGIYEKALPDNLSFEDKLKFAKELGYDFLEISIDESDNRLKRLEWTKDERYKIVSAMQEIGLPIRSMCLSGHRKYPMGSLNEDIRKKSMEIAKKAIQLADDLGVRIIQVAGYDVYYEEGNEITEKYFRENLRQFTELASSKGILLGFETMETSFMDTVEKSMKYVKLINSPYLGIYPDSGNLNNAAILYEHNLLNDLEKGRGKIFAMHLKETVPGKYRNMHFGEGIVDFDSIVKKAKSLGVNRFVTEFWHLGEEDFMNVIKSQNEYARKLLDKYYN